MCRPGRTLLPVAPFICALTAIASLLVGIRVDGAFRPTTVAPPAPRLALAG